MSAKCQHGDHIIEGASSPGQFYFYIDKSNGIGGTTICPECLLVHLSEHYPDSPNHKMLLAELGIENESPPQEV